MAKEKNLKQALAIGAAWMILLRTSVRLLGLVSTLILVRLLSPEDFGIAAIVMSFFALVELIAQFGFDTAIIQRQNAAREHYDTAWTLNLLFGLLAFTTINIAAPFIASFYGNPELQSMLLVVSLMFIINGATNVGVLDFRKNLTFDKEFSFHIFPKILSFLVTVGLAYYLQNVWALIIGSVSWKFFVFVSSYVMHPFRPRFDLSKFHDLFNFSKWLVLSNFIGFLNNRLPELLIGKLMSARATGLFSVSNELASIPTEEFIANISRASYPVYAKISHIKQKLGEMYLQVSAVIATIVLPVGVGIASVSTLLVPVVIGEQWIDAIVIIQFLAIARMFSALTSNASCVFLAINQPRINTLFGLAKVIFTIPLMFHFLSGQDLAGFTLSYAVVLFVFLMASNYVVARNLQISFISNLTICIRPTVAAIAMYLVVVDITPAAIEAWGENLFTLLVVIGAGAMVYGVTLMAQWLVIGRPHGPEQQGINKLSELISARLGRAA